MLKVFRPFSGPGMGLVVRSLRPEPRGGGRRLRGAGPAIGGREQPGARRVAGASSRVRGPGREQGGRGHDHHPGQTGEVTILGDLY